MIAVKGNKEVKILEMQKEEYLEKGYKILDKNLKVVACPSTKEEKADKLEKQVEELKAKIEKLETENKKVKAEANKKTENKKTKAE